MVPVPIRELAVVWCGRGKRRVPVLLKACFDASCGDGTYAVGGYVGDEAAWTALEAEWSEGLETFGLRDFHMTDVWHEMGREVGTLCVMHFSRIVGRSNVHAIGASCNLSEISERVPDRHPYHICLERVLSLVRQSSELEFENDAVAIILDDDLRPRDTAQGMFDAYKESSDGQFTSLAFGNRRSCLPIQCADLAVGALRKEWVKGMFGPQQETLQEFFGAAGVRGRFVHLGSG